MPCKSLVFSIIFVSCCVAIAYGCSCAAVDRKTKFCKQSDFSLKGQPFYYGTESVNGIYYRKYCIHIHHVFKPWYLPETCVYTPLSGAMCGVYFVEGGEYIISGYFSAGRMFVNLCGWNELWSSIPYHIKNSVYNPLWCDIPSSPLSLLSKLPRRLRKAILD